MNRRLEDIFTLTAREGIEIAARLLLAAVFGAAVGYGGEAPTSLQDFGRCPWWPWAQRYSQ